MPRRDQGRRKPAELPADALADETVPASAAEPAEAADTSTEPDASEPASSRSELWEYRRWLKERFH